MLKKSKFQRIVDESKIESAAKLTPCKTLFKVELGKRDIIHIKFFNVDFIKPGQNSSEYGVSKVKELSIFCIYLSYSPKDGVKRRKKVLKHLSKWTRFLKKKDIPFFVVGDFNTNLAKLPSMKEIEQSRTEDSQGIKMSKKRHTPQIYMTDEEVPLLQEIKSITTLEDMLTQHGLTRRRKLKSGKRERSRIDYLLTNNLNIGQVIGFRSEQEYTDLVEKEYALKNGSKGSGSEVDFLRNGKCEWVNDSNMVSDHYAFRFRISSKLS